LNIERAEEIIRLQKEMLESLESGEEHNDADFQERFLLLADEFLEAVKAAKP
jgi:hypothetical protein